MEYRQSEQTHYVGNDVIVLTYTSKTTDGHVYLIDDLYVIINARAIVVPDSWMRQPTALVVRKIVAMYGANQEAA